MKVAPVMRGMAAREGRFEQRLVHTGQHYDAAMSQVFFDELGITPPDDNLEVGSGSHAAQTEEIIRLVTDALADLLLTPSPDADLNLRNEGVPESRIRQVGNVMIDTLAANLERARERQAPRRFGLEPRRYVYVTLHRPSNVDTHESLAAIASCLLDVSRRAPVVFPVHPRTRQRLHDFGLLESLASARSVKLIEP